MRTPITTRLRNLFQRRDEAPPPAPPAEPTQPVTEEVARPGLTCVRHAWPTETMVAGLTPDRLTVILQQANAGDMDAFLTLAEEMEERDPHYGSVLQTRKLAVLGLDRKITWSETDADHPLAEEIGAACEKLIEAPAFEDLLFHMLDAIAKGYAAPEIMWSLTAERWTPARYEWRDPRWFRFDRETGRELRLKEDGAPDGVELPRFKFAVHIANRKSGLAARGGLARLVALSFVCKLYGLKDWMAYAEIFGIPLRLGRYDGSATDKDVAVLKQAVFGLGSDAAAVIPKSMDIEFPNLGGAAGGAELFETMVTFLDNQVSKAVLGQTGTTDMQKGGGYAQSKVLDGVREDLVKADAKSISGSATASIIAPFVRFNWGPDAPVPRCELVVEEPEDMAALSGALDKLVPLGLKVGQREIRRKLKLSEPDEREDTLVPPTTASAAAQGAAPADPKADPGGAPIDDPQADPKADPQARQALARVADPPSTVREELLTEIQLAELEGWAPTFGPEARALMDLVQGAASFDEVLAGLKVMAGDLNSPLVARSLARAMFEAAVVAQHGREDPATRQDG